MLNEQVTTSARPDAETSEEPAWLAKALRIEWLGQMVASVCWIASVFSYGLTSTGDWLQLCAASAWFVANIAALLASEAD